MPRDALPDDPETLKAMLLAERMQNERLRQIIKEMQRHRFGRRAETLPEDQMLLGLEDVEQTVAGDEAATDQMTPAERAARAERRRTGSFRRAIVMSLRCHLTSSDAGIFSRRGITDNNRSPRNMGYSECFRAFLVTW
jgi:hypothetical protein